MQIIIIYFFTIKERFILPLITNISGSIKVNKNYLYIRINPILF